MLHSIGKSHDVIATLLDTVLVPHSGNHYVPTWRNASIIRGILFVILVQQVKKSVNTNKINVLTTGSFRYT